MTPTKKFENFFMPLVQQVEGLAYIGMSDANNMDRLLAASRSEETYPGVYLIRPKMTGSTDAAMSMYFHVIFYVFVQGELDENESVDAAYEESEAYMQQIAMNIQHSAYEGHCFYDFNTFMAEPVSYKLMDAAYGYEVKMKIGLPVNDIMC